jgi:hypothetical protein
MPAVRAFDDPAPRPPTHPTDERRFAFLANVRGDAAIPDNRVAVSDCIALIETTMPRTTHAAASLEHHGIERRREGPLVVQIRAAENNADRYATSIGQDVALRPALRAVRWVWPCEIPPFGAFTMAESRAPHCH